MSRRKKRQRKSTTICREKKSARIKRTEKEHESILSVKKKKIISKRIGTIENVCHTHIMHIKV